MKCLDLKQLVLFIFQMMKKWSPTAKARDIDQHEILMKCLDLKQLVLFIFQMMKKWSPTAKTCMLCNMKQDMKVMKNKS